MKPLRLTVQYEYLTDEEIFFPDQARITHSLFGNVKTSQNY